MSSQNIDDNEVIAEEETKTKKTSQRKSTKRTEKKLLATLYEVNPKTKRKVEVDINDGSIDWKNVKEDRARLYCFYYTLAGAPSYHNSAESYRMTGTKCKDSQVLAVAAFKFRQKHPEITQFISDFEENINPACAKPLAVFYKELFCGLLEIGANKKLYYKFVIA